jgi:hypothetical protein
MVAKRYNHKYLSEKVYNDLSDLVYLLWRLDVIPFGERTPVLNMHSFACTTMLRMATSRFTRMANKQQYEEDQAQHR